MLGSVNRYFARAFKAENKRVAAGGVGADFLAFVKGKRVMLTAEFCARVLLYNLPVAAVYPVF